jgi:hypothetical protein
MKGTDLQKWRNELFRLEGWVRRAELNGEPADGVFVELAGAGDAAHLQLLGHGKYSASKRAPGGPSA